MSIRKIIDWAIESGQGTKKGTIASPFYQMYDRDGNWVWACDVDIGDPNNVLRSVPIASNNKDIIYAEVGKGVSLTRLNNGKWSITGLSKAVNSTIHYIFVTFEEGVFSIARKELTGFSVRVLTYEELGTLIEPFGYGTLPYEAIGRFDLDGNLIEIVGS